MVDAAHSKESHARDTINQLKLEISNLTKLVESGAGLNFGQDTSVQELTKMKDELIQQRDEQLKEIVTVCWMATYFFFSHAASFLNYGFVVEEKTCAVNRDPAQSRAREDCN